MLANSKMLSCSVLAVMEKVQQSLAPVFVCVFFFFVGGYGPGRLALVPQALCLLDAHLIVGNAPTGPGTRYVAHVALRVRCCACWFARTRARYLVCCFFVSLPPITLLSTCFL